MTIVIRGIAITTEEPTEKDVAFFTQVKYLAQEHVKAGSPRSRG